MQHETSNMEINTAGYRKLNAFIAANSLVIDIYKVTRKYPKDELFGLISQMRRAVVSIAANIVEGYSRRTNKEKINFYYISRGSLCEVEYYIDLSLELGYIGKSEHINLLKLKGDTGKLLNGLIRFMEK